MNKWIDDRLDALGKTKIGLAQALNLRRPATINDMVAGKRAIRPDEIKPMADYLEMSEAEVYERVSGSPGGVMARDIPANAIPADAAPPLPDRMHMPKDVEVRGIAVGGKDGEFMFNGGIIDRVRRPPGISNLKHVAAIYVSGDSMVPWRSPGDLVYFSDLRPAKLGDHVIVEMHPRSDGEAGKALLKKLVGRTGSKLRLEQYNPPDDRIEVDAAKVKTIFRVIDWSELLGV